MALLKDTDILRAHAAAVAAGMSRGALLAGNDRYLVAEIPHEATLGRQLLTDLRVLNEAGKSTDGTVPLEIWLTTAGHMSRLSVEAEVFRSCSELCRIAAARIPASPPRTTWLTTPSRVLSNLSQLAPTEPCLFDPTQCVTFLDAVTTANLISDSARESLLAGIEPAIRCEIPADETVIGQIALDVAVLNRKTLGGLPIMRWLANACFLSSARRQRTVFSDGMAALVTRADNPSLLLASNPPLATAIESILAFAAIHLRHSQSDGQRGLADLAATMHAGPGSDATSSSTALLLFYSLYSTGPDPNGEFPLLRWLKNLRTVAEVKDTDPISTALHEFSARYVQCRRTS